MSARLAPLAAIVLLLASCGEPVLESTAEAGVVDLAVGGKFSATDNLRLVGNVVIPVNSGGLRAGVAWTAGLNLLAPIFDGGVLRENVNIATAEQEQSLAAYGQAATNAFRELETSLDQGIVVQQRIEDLQEAAREAQEAFRIARLRYEEGEEDLLNVLTIQQRGISSRSSLSIAERLQLEQRVNLNLALGGSWEN